MEFTVIVEEFQKRFYLPEPEPLYVVAASWLAGLMDKPVPVWMMLIGRSGSGGSTLVEILTGLANTYMTDTLTLGALLSGSSKRDRKSDATGGLLRQIGTNTYGSIIFSDFTTLLTHEDSKEFSDLMRALRRIYDGEWTRSIGTDGASQLKWRGRVSVISKTTNLIDDYQAAMAGGPRFIYYRLPEIDNETMAIHAMRLGNTSALKKQIAELTSEFMREVIGIENWNALKNKAPPSWLSSYIPEDANRDMRLTKLAGLTSMCRAVVKRAGGTHQITKIHPDETWARIAQTFDTLYCSLMLLGLDKEQAWNIVSKCSIDSAPGYRGFIINLLLSSNNQSLKREEIDEVMRNARMNITPSILYRELQDMVAINILHQGNASPGQERRKGRPALGYKLNPEVVDFWNKSRL